MPKKSEGQKAADRLEQEEEKKLRSYALKCSPRKKELGTQFRRYKNTLLEYRTEYQRDRDRIIWSRSFKRLQHKTQIFPAYSTDHFRRRLTHVLEVSQVATSIARALGINEDATEAMALAHDIGHAPFGHAGEDALEEALQERAPRKKGKQAKKKYKEKVPVYSFTHALQSIETVERVEREYEDNYPGLNLSRDVREGILKHRRFRGDDKLSIRTLDDVVAFPAYEVFGNDPGPLEAQCVLLADKITYFFEDFEDALSSHIVLHP
jgi:dGTPase